MARFSARTNLISTPDMASHSAPCEIISSPDHPSSTYTATKLNQRQRQRLIKTSLLYLISHLFSLSPSLWVIFSPALSAQQREKKRKFVRFIGWGCAIIRWESERRCECHAAGIIFLRPNRDLKSWKSVSISFVIQRDAHLICAEWKKSIPFITH